VKELFTQLQNRILRFDGVSVVSPEMVAQCLLLGATPAKLRVTSDCWEVSQFNQNSPDEEQIKVGADDPVSLNLRWHLPLEYQELDLHGYLLDTAAPIISERYDESDQSIAIQRVVDELEEINRRGMVEFIKTIIFVIDTFKKDGVVWGVGRGSSCASFILFILGLHSVDCIRLDVPMSEFFHD